MTRDEYRRSAVSAKRKRQGLGRWFLLILSSPVVLVMFVGDAFAAPFVARRHQTTARGLICMAARFLGPVIIIGLCLGYLMRR